MTNPTQKSRGYFDRIKNQTLAWAMGRPYHEPVDNECCPDFSCCCPELFEQDEAKRWQRYSERYGKQ